MKLYNLLVVVRTATLETSKGGNVYYKLEVQQLASKEVDASLWTSKYVTTTTTKALGVMVKVTTMLRCSESFYKLWLKGKVSNGNVLILTVEEHIAGITEYLDKDTIKRVHGEELIANELAVIGDTSFDIVEAQQAIAIDLVIINGSKQLQGELDEVLPYLIKSVERAGINNNRFEL